MKSENVNHLTSGDIMICIGNENNRKQWENVTYCLFLFFFAERLSFSSYCSQEGLCQGSQASSTEGPQA